MPRINAIWAQDRGRIIGSKDAMLWSIPADLALFQEKTMGCPIIMGRATFEAMGRPLPGRTNIVITRQKDYAVRGVTVVGSVEQAIEEAKKALQEDPEPAPEQRAIWVTGGGEIYRQTLPLLDRIYLSQIDLDADTDTPVLAPDIAAMPGQWQLNEDLSDQDWRPRSGDARWKLEVYDKSALP